MDSPATWILRCDGGARGNPGPAAAAWVLFDPSGTEIESQGEYLGSATNNVAEYRGLIGGLKAASRHGAQRVRIYMDSELVVRQMTGEYRVKNAGLKSLHEEATHETGRFAAVVFRAVPRADNARADQLVNDTLDRVLSSESSR